MQDHHSAFHRANDLLAGIADFYFYLPLKPVRVIPNGSLPPHPL